MIQTCHGTRNYVVERQRRKASTGSLNGFGRALFSLSPFFDNNHISAYWQGSQKAPIIKKRREQRRK